MYVYKCKDCNKIKLRGEGHLCGYTRCLNCEQIVEENSHECYMKVKVVKGVPPLYIFFDYEAEQDTGFHKPNLIVAQYFDGTTFYFRTNDEFCKWLISPQHKNYIAIAHNAKGYDSQFILKYCVDNTLKPYTIYNGNKFMLLKVANIRIIDGHNFVASPLSAFPKTFGLDELKKGYFPHYFNTPENQNYVGPIPDTKFYGADTMEKSARQKFMKWHAEKVKEGYV